LSFVLVIGDPKRFSSAERLAAYLGLVPRRDQSGEVDKQLGITKQGNSFIRRYLIQGANYILGHYGEDCDLKTHGLKIAARGGKIAKRKAAVAVARKLSGLMYTLWQNDEVYDPHYKQNHRRKTA
jgi:transposase